MGHIILITGSREATSVMLDAAQWVVWWAKAKGHHIVVGDASGIDAEVRVACRDAELQPHVWGAYGKIRQPYLNPEGERRHVIRGNYLARDRAMVERCEWCIGLWNGTSRGTRYTLDYAESLGRKVIRRVFTTGAEKR